MALIPRPFLSDRARATLSLTSLAVFLNSVASFFSTEVSWVRCLYVVAAAVTLLALLHGWQSSRPFVLGVDPDDWRPLGDDELVVSIAAVRHGKGAAAGARVERPDDDSHELVTTDIRTKADGEIQIVISKVSGGMPARIVVT